MMMASPVHKFTVQITMRKHHMSEDVNINNQCPGVEYDPTESGGAYHEDREVTPTSGSSQMFRTYNAQFNKSTFEWGFPPGGSAPAYATVQNSDGSLHFFTNPSEAEAWTTWAGSGNNTVFNAVDFASRREIRLAMQISLHCRMRSTQRQPRQPKIQVAAAPSTSPPVLTSSAGKLIFLTVRDFLTPASLSKAQVPAAPSSHSKAAARPSRFRG